MEYANSLKTRVDYFVEEDEMIKTTSKLDNIMEYKILNKDNYERIMEALGVKMSKISRIRILNLSYNHDTIKLMMRHLILVERVH